MHYSQIVRMVEKKAAACGRKASEITLIVVSKTHSVESIQPIYQAGGRDFAESRLPEALEKIPQMPPDCRWHLIGTLQSKKVAKAIGSFVLIHSVGTLSLAQKISECSKSKGISTPILLQVNTSGEKAKHGLSADEWERVLEAANEYSHLKIEGLMTMAPFTQDQKIIRECFRTLFELREKWKNKMREPAVFNHLSMGMTNDYLIAIEEGATLLRVGSAIFTVE